MTELFDSEIQSLFKQSQSILNSRYNGKPRKEVGYLERYISIYSRMKAPEEFFRDFKNLYSLYRYNILNTLDDDKWLREGDVVIRFGEGIPALDEKCKDIKIMLSHIYKCATELRDIAKETFVGLSDDLIADNKDLILPSILLLHLLRIFYAILEEEQKVLTPLISKLEDDLQVKNKIIKPVTNLPSLSSLGDVSQALSSVFNVFLNVAKDANIPLPPDMTAPTKDQFEEGVKNVMENPKIKGVLNEVATNINNGGDMGTMIKSLMTNFLDQDTLDSMKDSLLKTAEIARENSQK